MKPDAENKITAQFNNLKSRYLETWGKTGTLTAIKNISTLISELQAAGLDVSLEIVPPTDLHDTLSQIRDPAFGGKIRSGKTERLIAFATYGYEGFLYISKPITPDQNTVYVEAAYKVNPNEPPFAQLQERIIDDCVRQEIIAECDIAQAFSDNKKITKPPFFKPPRHD